MRNAITLQSIGRSRGQFTPWQMGRHLWAHRALIVQLGKHQIRERYRGSYLGLVWSVATPLAMLLAYTFAFSVVFKVRWPEIESDSPFDFALFLFTGLIVFNLFSESVLAAPQIIVNRPNFVKRMVFPLEVLPVSGLIALLVQSLLGLAILLLVAGIAFRSLPPTLLLLPLLYLPLILLCLGASWFLASLGVYLRDTEHLLRILVQILLFLTPIFYPASAVPDPFRGFLQLNPLAHLIQFFRQVILLGQVPDWGAFLVITVLALATCFAGYVWFMRSKKTFADIM